MSFNHDLNRVLKGGKVPSSPEEFLSSEDVFVLGPNSDIQLLNFQHIILNNSDGYLAKFQILDPNHKLENLIFKSLKKDKIYDRLVQIRKESEITKSLSKQRNVIGPALSEDFITENLFEEEEALYSLYNEFILKEKELSTSISNGIECVILYGAGSNKALWSGTYIGALRYINFKYSGDAGARILELEITAGETKNLTLQDKINNIGSFATNIVGQSIPINRGTTSFNPIMKIVESGIRSYLTQLTGIENVVVMLPDITQTTAFQNKFGKTVETGNGFEQPFNFIGDIKKENIYSSYENILRDLGFEIRFDVETPRILNKYPTNKPLGAKEEVSRSIKSKNAVIISDSKSMEDGRRYGNFQAVIDSLTSYVLSDSLDTGLLFDSVITKVESVSKNCSFLKRKLKDTNQIINTIDNRIIIFGSKNLIKHVLYGIPYLDFNKKQIIKIPSLEYSNSNILNESYIKEAFDVFFPKIEEAYQGTEYYDSVVVEPWTSTSTDVPSAFGDSLILAVSLTKLKNIFKRLRLPVLKAGAVRNQNVLDFSIQQENLYNMATGIFQDKVTSIVKEAQAESKFTKILNTNENFKNFLDKYKNGDLTKIYEEKKALLEAKEEEVREYALDTIAAVGASPATDALRADLIDQESKDRRIPELSADLKKFANILGVLKELSDAIDGNKEEGFVITYDTDALSFDNAVSQYLNNNQKYSITLNIDALPHFYLDTKYIGQPAFFEFKEAGIVGNKADISNKELLNILDGQYIIIGIVHNISPSKVSTTFTLIKDNTLE
jgi:hypothetical protein